MLIPAYPLQFRKRRSGRKGAAPRPTPPPAAGARIIDVWLDDPQTISVQFDQPIVVAGGSTTDVGAWVVNDGVGGVIVPIEMDQVDVDIIWFITPTDMTSGTIGFSGGNVGALTSADGFPSSDQGSYP